MKLMICVSSLRGGGAERAAVDVAGTLARAGHEVVLLVTFPGREAPAYPIDDQITLRWLSEEPRAVRSLLQQAQRFRTLREALRRERPDLVISFLTNVNVAVLLASLGLRLEIVVSERTHPKRFPLSRALRLARRLTYPRASALVVQTQRSAAWYTRAFGKAPVVIANALQLPLAAHSPCLEPATIIAAEKKLVLAVGRMDRHKGHAELLDAFASAAAAQPDWRLVILGDGEERASLEAQALRRGIADRVHMPGWAGNVGAWFERADLFVHPSHFEGFPNVLLEAMGHGLPVVSYDCEYGPAELIDHNRSGLLVSPGEGAEGLAQTLTQLMGEQERRSALGEAAAKAAAAYAPDRIMGQWLELARQSVRKNH